MQNIWAIYNDQTAEVTSNGLRLTPEIKYHPAIRQEIIAVGEFYRRLGSGGQDVAQVLPFAAYLYLPEAALVSWQELKITAPACLETARRADTRWAASRANEAFIPKPGEHDYNVMLDLANYLSERYANASDETWDIWQVESMRLVYAFCLIVFNSQPMVLGRDSVQ